MNSLDDLALLIAIVDAGSMAAAARAQGMPKSSVTRRLAALEARLNTRLLHRNTRGLSLTEPGRWLYDRLHPLVAEARMAEAELMSETAGPSGTLRLTATGAFGRLFIAPILGAYLHRHPSVNAELLLLDRPVNLIEEGFDLAIRMGPLTDSGLLRRKLVDIERVLCATPAYLTARGAITQLSDLKSVKGLVTTEGNRWTFEAGGKVVTVVPQSRLASNQLEVLRAAVLGGCGVTVLPNFLVADDLAAGRLVRLLDDIPVVPGVAHALWPSGRNLPVRTRSFIEFAANQLGRSDDFGLAPHVIQG